MCQQNTLELPHTVAQAQQQAMYLCGLLRSGTGWAMCSSYPTQTALLRVAQAQQQANVTGYLELPHTGRSNSNGLCTNNRLPWTASHTGRPQAATGYVPAGYPLHGSLKHSNCTSKLPWSCLTVSSNATTAISASRLPDCLTVIGTENMYQQATLGCGSLRALAADCNVPAGYLGLPPGRSSTATGYVPASYLGTASHGSLKHSSNGMCTSQALRLPHTDRSNWQQTMYHLELPHTGQLKHSNGLCTSRLTAWFSSVRSTTWAMYSRLPWAASHGSLKHSNRLYRQTLDCLTRVAQAQQQAMWQTTSPAASHRSASTTGWAKATSRLHGCAAGSCKQTTGYVPTKLFPASHTGQLKHQQQACLELPHWPLKHQRLTASTASHRIAQAQPNRLCTNNYLDCPSRIIGTAADYAERSWRLPLRTLRHNIDGQAGYWGCLTVKQAQPAVLAWRFAGNTSTGQLKHSQTDVPANYLGAAWDSSSTGNGLCQQATLELPHTDHSSTLGYVPNKLLAELPHTGQLKHMKAGYVPAGAPDCLTRTMAATGYNIYQRATQGCLTRVSSSTATDCHFMDGLPHGQSLQRRLCAKRAAQRAALRIAQALGCQRLPSRELLHAGRLRRSSRLCASGLP
jgi:hypothetical protein